MPRETIVEVCIYRNCVDHECKLRNPPTHDDGNDTEVFLERGAKYQKSADK